MSTASRQRHPKQPSPESGRPRLRNARPKLKPLDITAYQAEMHKSSSGQVTRKTAGAFGGVTKEARHIKALIRSLGQKRVVRKGAQ